MRVIAGSARRLLLVTPPGLDTRPTQDKIKETLFNILQMQVPGSVFLDICAGSGGIGIEAISRGARRAYFIENGRAAISCIQQNLHKTGFEDQAVILRQDAVAALRQVHEKEVDLVYLDPPYKSDLARRVLTASHISRKIPALLSKQIWTVIFLSLMIPVLKYTGKKITEATAISLSAERPCLRTEVLRHCRKSGKGTLNQQP